MCRDPDKDLTGEEHGDDLSIDGEVSMLDHVKEQLKARFLVKSANITSLMLGYERQGTCSQANSFSEPVWMAS